MFDVCVFHRLKGCLCELIKYHRRFYLRRFQEVWQDPCESWRVTCYGQSFEICGAPLGPKYQEWPSCNHQWSKGAWLDLDTDT